MIVIEGRYLTKLKCKDFINEVKGKVLLINTVRENLNFITNKNVQFLRESKGNIYDRILNKQLQQQVKSYDLIIFYFQGDEKDIKNIKEFENEVNRKCIVTIYNYDKDLGVYEL